MKVFISSTSIDLKAYRKAAKETVLKDMSTNTEYRYRIQEGMRFLLLTTSIFFIARFYDAVN